MGTVIVGTVMLVIVGIVIVGTLILGIVGIVSVIGKVGIVNCLLIGFPREHAKKKRNLK